MKAVIQRVSRASVAIEGEYVGAIGPGMVILFCVVEGDEESALDFMVRKCTSLRIFDDEKGVMNRSILDVGGEVLIVSQFTLAASVKKGNRPSYVAAAPPKIAVPIYEKFCRRMEETLGRPIPTGRFGADMQVELVNNGPVTIIIDTNNL